MKISFIGGDALWLLGVIDDILEELGAAARRGARFAMI